MDNSGDFFTDLSILIRNVRKYFDHELDKFAIGSGQLIFLLAINEHEGITMQQLAAIGEFDKGTVSVGVQKLIDEGYVEVVKDENDKRIRHLYTSSSGRSIMPEIYRIRNGCYATLADENDQLQFSQLLAKYMRKSRIFNTDRNYDGMKIAGLQKLTLLDYPDTVACTVFMGGCNFKCPFCHNRDLVYMPAHLTFYNPNEIFEFLRKRQGILDGVCISGGEPLLQPGIFDFITEVKEMGYKVKLDTNGFYPEQLKALVESGNVDYVAMDIKNCREKYGMSAGISDEKFKIEKIQQSMDYLKNCQVEYEFRTTVVRQLHTAEDLKSLAHWIEGCQHYYLQQFIDSGNTIEPGYSGYNKQEMEELLKQVQTILPHAQLRGVK